MLKESDEQNNFVSNNLGKKLGLEVKKYVNLLIKTISNKEPTIRKTPVYNLCILLNNNIGKNIFAFGI